MLRQLRKLSHRFHRFSSRRDGPQRRRRCFKPRSDRSDGTAAAPRQRTGASQRRLGLSNTEALRSTAYQAQLRGYLRRIESIADGLGLPV